MTGPRQTPDGSDDGTGTTLRHMFAAAAARITPTRPAPVPGLGATAPRAPRRVPWGVTVALALCVAVAVAVVVDVHPSGVRPAGGSGVAGQLLIVKSDGAVQLLSPDTGAVVRTLVGPSPVDADGRHLGRPVGITAAGDVAYIGYLAPSPVIESIPFGGGTPTFVTDGLDPSASHDGTELAFFEVTPGASSGAVAIRVLATGAQHAVYSSPSGPIVDGLSWSADDTQLAVSGLFVPSTPLSIEEGVQLLDLDQPVSSTNPRFLGTPTALTAGTSIWTDAQFLDSGDVAVLSNRPARSPCQAAPTQVLSVDPTTGRATTLATVAFQITDAVFDQTGGLVAFQATEAPATCRAAPTTTTKTTTTTTTPTNGVTGRVEVTGGGSFSTTIGAVASQYVLDGWSDGTTRTLATAVTAVALVP